MTYAFSEIDSPAFLGFFTLFSIVVVAVAYFVSRSGRSDELPIPSLNAFAPTQIAALLDEKYHVIQVAIYTLLSKRMVEISGSGGETAVVAIPANKLPYDNIEKEVHQFLKKPRNGSTVITELYESGKFGGWIDKTHSQLEQANLRLGNSEYRRQVFLFAVSATIITVIGLSKVGFYIENHVPFGPLLFAILIFNLINYYLVFPRKRITRLGVKYIEQLKTNFGWQKDIVSGNGYKENFDLGYVVALYGTGILAKRSYIDFFRLNRKRSVYLWKNYRNKRVVRFGCIGCVGCD